MYFFTDNQHRKNYEWLMQKYQLKQGQDLEYEANIYIAAYPAIFRCFREDSIDLTVGPLADLLFDDNRVHNSGALTGSTKRMAELGMSLFNSYQVSLDEIFGSVTDEELVDVCIEAIRIRAREYR